MPAPKTPDPSPEQPKLSESCSAPPAVKPNFDQCPQIGLKRRRFKVLYVFFRGARKASIKQSIKEVLALRNLAEEVDFEMDEVDILVDPVEHDMMRDDKQDQYVRLVENGGYDFVVVSPPCNTWTRAVWRDKFGGPRPIRDKAHP